MADYESRVSRGLHGKEKDIKKGNKNEVSHTSPAYHRGQGIPALSYSRESIGSWSVTSTEMSIRVERGENGGEES